jgi:hypothetical protein
MAPSTTTRIGRESGRKPSGFRDLPWGQSGYRGAAPGWITKEQFQEQLQEMVTPARTQPTFRTEPGLVQGPKQALIYHVAGVLDASVSMEDLETVAGTVMDGQVQRLSGLSTRLDLETRATLYTFGAPTDMRCLYFDGFILIVITDGKENSSRQSPQALRQKLESLPANWTVAIMVPDQMSVLEAESYGFPRQNIAVWETTRGGMEDAGERLYEATERRITQAATSGTTRAVPGSGYFHFDTQRL